MNYSFILQQEAVKEFAEAYAWYEEQRDGLGVLFETKFKNKLNQICNHPFHYKVSYRNFHEALVDTFPFLIVYAIDERIKLIVVIAVFHTSRNPKKKTRK